jgi:hypothetical protein
LAYHKLEEAGGEAGILNAETDIEKGATSRSRRKSLRTIDNSSECPTGLLSGFPVLVDGCQWQGFPGVKNP